MASFLNELTHRYDFDETSGLIQDKIGTANALVTTVTSYNGDSVSLDGINDKIDFPDAGWISNGDWTYYLDLTLVNPDNQVPVMATTTGTVPRMGEIFYKSPIATTQWLISTLVGGGATRADAHPDVGLPSAGDRIGIAASWNDTTKILETVVKNFTKSITGTATSNVGVGTGAEDGFKLGTNDSETSWFEGDFFEFGVLDSKVKSIQDMKDTLDHVFTGIDPNNPPVQGPGYFLGSPHWSKRQRLRGRKRGRR